MDDRALRDKVVLAMLPDVPFEGWSRRALRHAAKRVDLTEAELSSLFPRGVRDVVAAFSDWADRATEATLAKQHSARLKLRERIALGVRTRLAVLEPHREAVRRMLAYLTLPANLPLGPSSSLWPLLSAGYSYSKDKSGLYGASSTVKNANFEVVLPLLIHPITHFFIGAGPFVHITAFRSGGGDSLTNVGLISMLGGWW